MGNHYFLKKLNHTTREEKKIDIIIINFSYDKSLTEHYDLTMYLKHEAISTFSC